MYIIHMHLETITISWGEGTTKRGLFTGVHTQQTIKNSVERLDVNGFNQQKWGSQSTM